MNYGAYTKQCHDYNGEDQKMKSKVHIDVLIWLWSDNCQLLDIHQT